MTTNDIINLEERIQSLRKDIDAFRHKHKQELEHTPYADFYNYLGTLKLNTLSLGRSLAKLADDIRIERM